MFKAWEAECRRMNHAIPKPSDQLGIGGSLLETLQLYYIITAQLSFLDQAVVLSSHQIYLSQQLGML